MLEDPVALPLPQCLSQINDYLFSQREIEDMTVLRANDWTIELAALYFVCVLDI